MAKLYVPEAYERVLTDAAQVLGGDGWTRFYPVENFLRDAKVNHIGAGTSEVMRMVIFRQGLRTMKDELKMPCREMHPKLGVPISVIKPATIVDIDEKTVLEMLAEDYRVNPGLHMSRGDMKRRLHGVNDEQLDKILMPLETKGLVKLYRDRRGNIALAKATYKGLRKARPPAYYKWFPEWVNKEHLF